LTPGRVVALDHGAARCGVAVSDPTGTLTTPLEPVLRPDTRKGLARVRQVIADHGAVKVVVGLPLSLSGADSDQTRAARAFAQRLAATLDVPVELHDERFTTRIAQRTGGSASEDSRAAAVLLEDFLAADAQSGHSY
jgi:putative holliday junction resolvase